MSSIDDWEQATILEADAYLALRGNIEWTGSDEVKTQALQRSWDYLRGLKWLPSVFDIEMPDNIKSAHIVGALEELKSAGILLPALTSENYLLSKNIAGVIQKAYRAGAPVCKVFIEINVLLRGYKQPDNCLELKRG